jgi:hypothetical protein
MIKAKLALLPLADNIIVVLLNPSKIARETNPSGPEKVQTKLSVTLKARVYTTES